MANPSWFNEAYYLNSKLEQLQANGETAYTNVLQVQAAIEAAGMTVYEHFSKFSLEEGTSPNQYFNTNEYLAAKAAQAGMSVPELMLAFDAAGFTNAYDHFARHGWLEGVNPSNAFDVSDYLAAKAVESGLSVAEVTAAFVAGGFDPISHYIEYGEDEGVAVTPVPADEQVDGGTGETFTLTTGMDNFEITTTNTVDTVKGFVDYDGTDDYSTLTTLDTVVGNGHTVLQVAVADVNSAAYTADYVELSGINKLEVKDAAGAGRLIMDASSYGTDISEISLSGAGGMDLSVTSMDVTGPLSISVASSGYAYASGDMDGLYFSATVTDVSGASTATFGVDGIATASGKGGSVELYLSQSADETSADATVGDITIGDIDVTVGLSADDTITIENLANADTSGAATVGDLTVGAVNIDIAASASFSMFLTNSAEADDGNATAGNITVGDINVTVADSGDMDEFTIYNSADVSGTGNAVVGDITIGNINIAMGDDATGMYMNMYNTADAGTKGTATAGNITFGDITITGGDDDSVTMYAYNEAWANGTDKNAVVGDLTVGAFNAEVGNNAYIYVSMSNYLGANTGSATAGDITLGNIDVVAGSSADLYFSYSADVNADKVATAGAMTLGDVNVSMGLASEFTLFLTNNASGSTASAVGDMTIGDIDVYGGADNDVSITIDQYAYAGTAGNVTIGNVTIEIENDGIGSANADFDLQVTGESVGDITVGNLSMTGGSGADMSASIDISATDTNIGDVSIGDIQYVAGENADQYFYGYIYADNDAGNITYGDINFDASALSAYNYGYIWNSADYGMLGDITMGDITLTAGESATADLYAYFSASDEIGNVTVGDITLNADGDLASVSLYHEVYNSDDIGTIEYGDITVSAIGAAAYAYGFISAENDDNNNIGTITVGDINLDVSGDSAYGWLSMTYTSADNIGLATVGNIAIDLATTDAAAFAATAGYVFESDAGDVTVGDITLTAAEVTGDFVATATMRGYVTLSADSTDGVLTVGDITVVGGLENSTTVADNFGNLAGWLNLSGDTINIGNIDYSGYEAAATIDLTGTKGGGAIKAAQGDTVITLNASQNAVTLYDGVDDVVVAKNTTGATAQATIDSITGFTAGTDDIQVDLTGSDFAFGGTIASYDTFLTTATNGFVNNGYEIFAAKVGTDTFVAFNTDGDTDLDFVVQLTGVASVDASDFFVV